MSHTRTKIRNYVIEAPKIRGLVAVGGYHFGILLGGLMTIMYGMVGSVIDGFDLYSGMDNLGIRVVVFVATIISLFTATDVVMFMFALFVAVEMYVNICGDMYDYFQIQYRIIFN